jgi:RNA-directed DNA polymerase
MRGAGNNIPLRLNLDSKQLFPTSEGVPQSGVVSPLLANIALHGMEYRIKDLFPKKSYCRNGKTHTVATPDLIRYADDFVIPHEDIAVVTRCTEVISIPTSLGDG